MPVSEWRLLLAGHLDEAVAAATERIAERPRDSIGYTNRGLIYLVQRRFPEASADFQQVIAIRPNSEHGFELYGACQWLQGERAEAIATWEKLLKVHPEYVDRQKVLDMIKVAKSQAS